MKRGVTKEKRKKEEEAKKKEEAKAESEKQDEMNKEYFDTQKRYKEASSKLPKKGICHVQDFTGKR